GAVDGKLLELDPQSLVPSREWVAHRAGTPILAILPFAEALLRLERKDGLHRIVLTYADGSEKSVEFDDPAYCIDLPPSPRYDALQLRIVHQTPASPPRHIDIDLADGTWALAGQERLRGLNPNAYRVERLHARAPDGEMIPITVLSSAEAAPNEALPLLLTGDGACGISYEPRFSLPATALVDAGFRYAIAHVRGGSEKGRRWYQDACRENKRNSMTDFIACAQHLVDIGYAAPGRIVAHGVSAGGLLVCGAMNLAPELWAGVIAQVPFVDIHKTMSVCDLQLVPLQRRDWGDPNSALEAYNYIAAISTYENVREAAYPPVLCTDGLKDDRVPNWEPAKLIANNRERST